MLVGLILILSFGLAAPAVTTTTPGTLIPGSTTTLYFTLKDENASSTATNPARLKIFYSTVSGGEQTLIVNDLNINDATTVRCSDYNFFTAKDCNYTWVVPSSLATNYYYVDYNFTPGPTYAPYAVSSGAFRVEQITGCGTMLLLFTIVCIVLAYFGVMKLMNGVVNPTVLMGLAVAVLLGIYVIVAFTSGICVIV